MNRTPLLFLLPFLGALPAVSQSIPGYAIANTKHYRESGVGNATGRSGSAHLTVRALQGKDGNTDIELSTGALDTSATPPGSFAKVQFKPLDPNGNALFAQNFTQLATPAGYYAFSSPSLARHQQAQFQVNINGIDRRTDVLTLVETVKLRPDVAVQPLHFPDSVLVNIPVTLHANLVELNGDAGATTTCQLIVDSVLVDQAKNAYIDAGGSVSCEFSYTFDATGGHNIQVTAASVSPADWDTDNNTASARLNVVGLNENTAEHGEATFSDQKGGFPLTNLYTYQAYFGGNLVGDYSQNTPSTGEQQNSHILLSSTGCTGVSNAQPYQFPVDITYTETMDGTPVYTSKAPGITGNVTVYPSSLPMCHVPTASYRVVTGTGIADDHTFNLVSATYYDSSNQPIWTNQQVESTRDAGDVTYLSSGYNCRFISVCSDPNNYYTWNTSNETVLGTTIPTGNTWVASLTATDASGTGFGGSMTASLSSAQVTTGQPKTCSTRTDNFGYTYQTCTTTSTDYTDIEGTATY